MDHHSLSGTPSRGEPLVTVEHLSKSFLDHDSFAVLEDLSFTIAQGELTTFLGPSGCGKSVLLYLLAGFLPPTEGTITMNGKPVVRPGPDRVLMFQHYALFPWQTVLGNVLAGLQASPLKGAEKVDQAVEYLNLVGLVQYRDWYVHKLSGGMQQRVALARALAARPKLLLMDEPFAALDAQYRQYLRSFLVRIWEKTETAIAFVTHSITEAIVLGDTVYLFTRRPVRIKQTYRVAIPRPRDHRDPGVLELRRQMQASLAEEFQSTLEETAPLSEERFLSFTH